MCKTVWSIFSLSFLAAYRHYDYSDLVTSLYVFSFIFKKKKKLSCSHASLHNRQSITYSVLPVFFVFSHIQIQTSCVYFSTKNPLYVSSPIGKTKNKFYSEQNISSIFLIGLYLPTPNNYICQTCNTHNIIFLHTSVVNRHYYFCIAYPILCTCPQNTLFYITSS